MIVNRYGSLQPCSTPQEVTMDGVIRGRDVLANARLIANEFGLRCLFRCFRACLFGPRTTFLDCVWEKKK